MTATATERFERALRQDEAEYDHEPVRGLPGRLPDGEHILWQGSPCWRRLARQVLLGRLVAIYFAALAIWRGAAAAMDGAEATTVIGAMLGLVPPAVLALGLIAMLAWAMARSTVYTITNRRVAMRIGVALTMTINLPFTRVGSADLKLYSDGTGEIPLALNGDDYFAYLVLWPHARPGRYRRPEPTLRCVPEAREVAGVLASALAATHGQAAQIDASAPERRPADADARSDMPINASAHLTPAE